MHDHMEYFLAGQDVPLTPSEKKPEVVYRWAIIVSIFVSTVRCWFHHTERYLCHAMCKYSSCAQHSFLNFHFIPLCSKPLTPTTLTNKALPFIKVIEIKSWMKRRPDDYPRVEYSVNMYLNTYLYIKCRSSVIKNGWFNRPHGDKAHWSFISTLWLLLRLFCISVLAFSVSNRI